MLDVNCISQNEATLLFPMCILSDCCPTLIITTETLSHSTNFYDLQVSLGVKNLIKKMSCGIKFQQNSTDREVIIMPQRTN